MNPFRPETALITGGGSGIGAALGKALADGGTRVFIADIDGAAARRVAEEIGSLGMPIELDVCEHQMVSEVIEGIAKTTGSVDLVVNCAGIASYGEVLDVTEKQWLSIINVNLWGTINVSLAAYAVMREQGRGCIVNMGSMSIYLQPPLLAPYVTSKAGVVGFSRALGVEAAAYGVDVTVVCPGNVKTPLLGGGGLNLGSRPRSRPPTPPHASSRG